MQDILENVLEKFWKVYALKVFSFRAAETFTKVNMELVYTAEQKQQKSVTPSERSYLKCGKRSGGKKEERRKKGNSSDTCMSPVLVAVIIEVLITIPAKPGLVEMPPRDVCIAHQRCFGWHGYIMQLCFSHSQYRKAIRPVQITSFLALSRTLESV